MLLFFEYGVIIMSKRRLTEVQERDVALSYLSHVSSKYIQKKWGVKEPTALLIVRKRSPEWKDPLVEFYREALKLSNRYRNAIHLYLATLGQAEGLPNVNLIDKEGEKTVYEAVDEDIFKPRINKLIYTDTGLGRIFSYSQPDELSPAERLLRAVFGEKTRLPETEDIILPMLYKSLRETYDRMGTRRAVGTAEKAFNRAFRRVELDVYKRLADGFLLLEDNGVREYLTQRKERFNAEFSDQIKKVLETLAPREEKVVRMRFGLDDGSQHTLAEVGTSFECTRERIKQIEAKALRKLRHPSRSGLLNKLYTL